MSSNSLGKPLRERAVLAAFHQILAKAGLPRLQDLRHTYGTRLFANNAHVGAVEELMGHNRLDMMLEIYASSVPRVLRETVDRLEAMFGDTQQVSH